MKLIQRDKYLDRLKSVQGTPDIKVITGVRRSGKSKLMESFIDYLRDYAGESNIIHVNFNFAQFDPLRDHRALHEYVESSYDPDKTNYVFIDEVQMCEGFENAINSLHASEKYDIYVTGSNAFLLSSDLATLFTGRTFEIEVFPFSFKEFCDYYELADIDRAFADYTREGGMAGSYPYREEADKYRYIASEFDTVIVRDIRQKYRIRSVDLLERLSSFLMDNIGNITTARSIADTLTSARNSVNHKTIGAYMGYFCNAFVFYRVRRYDVRGKKYLSSGDKYYLCDHSFKYAKLGTRNLDYGRTYENMVAIELLRRGYEVYAGVLYKKEIDFVAIKRDEKVYIQVSDDISKSSTFEREYGPLLQIRDAYPKMIIANTKHEAYTYEGIEVVDLARWLAGSDELLGDCTVDNWRHFVGRKDSGWRECQELEFKSLITQLSRVVERRSFSIWVAGASRPYTLSIFTDGFPDQASPWKPYANPMTFGIRMNPKDDYGYYYAENVSESPSRTELKSYDTLIGYRVDDVVEFVEDKLDAYVMEFGIPTAQPVKHTTRTNKISEANRVALVREIMKMIDWDQDADR